MLTFSFVSLFSQGHETESFNALSKEINLT